MAERDLQAACQIDKNGNYRVISMDCLNVLRCWMMVPKRRAASLARQELPGSTCRCRVAALAFSQKTPTCHPLRGAHGMTAKAPYAFA
jgi:hypothetical protein